MPFKLIDRPLTDCGRSTAQSEGGEEAARWRPRLSLNAVAAVSPGAEAAAAAQALLARPAARRTVWDAPEALRLPTGDMDIEFVPTRESDSYAFGFILFHLFTRREPFSNQVRASSLESVLRAVVDRDLRPFFPVSNPVSIRDLAASCWARNPAKRPSFAAIQEALEDVIEVRPRSCRPLVQLVLYDRRVPTPLRSTWLNVISQPPIFLTHQLPNRM
jgi:hypothetical protein